MANGAMGVDPQVQAQSTSTPEQQAARIQTRINYLTKRRPNDPEIAKLRKRLTALPQPQQPAAPGPTMDQQVGQTSADIINQMGGFAKTFDPSKFQMQYQPVYGETSDQAYNAIMSQFDIRNQKAFEQQKEALDQEAANKGWSPSGEQYQRRFRELQDAQNQARQEAQNQALLARQGVQQQAFEQAQSSALMPGQIAGQFETPYMAQFAARTAQDVAAQQQAYAKELAALEQKYRLQTIKATPRGGGGGGGADPMEAFNRYLLEQSIGRYQQQQPSTSPITSGAQAAASSFGSIFGQRLGQR
jgi:hypothetical protein